MKDYDKQAAEFLEKTNTTINKVFSHNGKHFANDKQVRDIYIVTIKRGNRQFNFNFGQSIMNSQYYQDRIPDRTYSLDGKSRTGNFKIVNMQYSKDYCTLVKGKIPTDYDILTCLTKYDPGTLEDFCSEFGYDEDSRKAYNTYTAVKEEYMNMCSLFNDEELELLNLIN